MGLWEDENKGGNDFYLSLLNYFIDLLNNIFISSLTILHIYLNNI